MHAHQFKLFVGPNLAVIISNSSDGPTAAILADKGARGTPSSENEPEYEVGLVRMWQL